MKCRICKSDNLEQIFENENCPKTSHKYLSEEELANDRRVTTTVLKCQNCSTVQLQDAYAEDEYVSDYQRNISFSKSALAHMEAMAKKLASLGVSNIVEIGCGNGTFAKFLLDSTGGKAKLTAFEPSQAAFKAALKNGINAHNMFFNGSVPGNFQDFDGFAMRFVLEHLDDPASVLAEVKNRCLPGAVGLIEVPNAQKQFKENRWFDYFAEHIIYFTPVTLANALEGFGFEVLSVEATMQDEFLAAFVSVPSNKQLKTPEEMKAEFCPMVEGLTYIWGASGGAMTFLSYIFTDELCSKNIRNIVDSDVNKWGLYASGSQVKIVSPQEIIHSPPETVIIMALSYEKEIRQQLEEMGYKGKVRSLRECL